MRLTTPLHTTRLAALAQLLLQLCPNITLHTVWRLHAAALQETVQHVIESCAALIETNTKQAFNTLYRRLLTTFHARFVDIKQLLILETFYNGLHQTRQFCTQVAKQVIANVRTFRKTLFQPLWL
jgi:hypothetical protein